MKLTYERANALLRYNPKTGVLTWRVYRHGARGGAGAMAGTLNRRNGYRYVGVDYRHHLIHRVAWLLQTGEWPRQQIDHKDGNRSNNRWRNLRLATQTQNNGNSRRSRKNKTGFKGVHVHAIPNLKKPFVAQIRINGKQTHIGCFATAKEAHNAYKHAARKQFSTFARTTS